MPSLVTISPPTDTAYATIARFIVPCHPRRGRLCPPQRWREYLEANRYVLPTGGPWRHPPHDFTVSGRIAPTISHIRLDKGHTGTAVRDAAKTRVTMDVVYAPNPTTASPPSRADR